MQSLAYFMKEIAKRPKKTKPKRESKAAKEEAIKIFNIIEIRLNEDD